MPAASIHYRRRWFYVLWSGLLVLSCAALFLWERPASRDQASLQVLLHLQGAPEGVKAQAWAGPAARFAGPDWTGAGAFAEAAMAPDGSVPLPLVRLWIARRRWVRDYIPRGTWDLVVVKLSPPSGAPRFLVLPCGKDIHSGILRAKHKEIISIDISWENLTLDAKPSNRVP